MSSASASATYVFEAEDRPVLPGGPFSPPHPVARRAGYAAVGLAIGALSTFSNALVSVNVSNLAGEQQQYVAELSWLPAIYVAANACANTVLVKARTEFSMPTVMRVVLLAYAASAALSMMVGGMPAEVLARLASGIAAAGMTTMTVYYLLQATPANARPAALVAGLGLTQLGTPLARLLPVDLLTAQGWMGLHCIELACALATLALIVWLPLPPTPRSAAFQPLDFVTVALLLPAMLLLCGVLNRGRLGWWTDTPWLGIATAVAIPMLTAVIVIECLRARPLLQLRWFGTLEFFGFALVALLVRLSLSEQSFGAVGLLAVANLDNDQFRPLFAWVALAMLLGIATAVVTLSKRALPWQVLAAALVIALGAWMDSHANNLTRPEQLYLSQSLVGFGTCLFIGPVIAYGVMKVIERGASHLVTLVVVFSMTQNVGGLIGTAALGSYETVAAREHYLRLASRLPAGDLPTQDRIVASVRSLSGTVVDPQVRVQQAGGELVASLSREAAILAFNDVFRVVWQLAMATALCVGLLLAVARFRNGPRAEAA